jgi:hypothetical protein
VSFSVITKELDASFLAQAFYVHSPFLHPPVKSSNEPEPVVDRSVGISLSLRVGREAADILAQWSLRLSEIDSPVPFSMTYHVNLLLSVGKTVRRTEGDYADLIKQRRTGAGWNDGEKMEVGRLNSA